MLTRLKGEIVPFFASDRIKLNGFLCSPKRRSKRAVIYLHGLRGNFYRGSYLGGFGKAATSNGFYFLSIEQRGSHIAFKMARKKNRKFKSLLGGGSFERFEDCVYDIEGAIRFLKRLGVREIFLVGHSTGCQKITYYQYKKKDKVVKGLVLLAPADDYNLNKKLLGRKFKPLIRFLNSNYPKNRDMLIPKEYIKERYSVGRFLSFSDLRFVESRIFNYDLDKLKEFGSIREPVLAIFGSREQYAFKPIKEYMKILGRNTNSKRFDYLIIKGANHGFDGKEKELANVVVKWLKELD